MRYTKPFHHFSHNHDIKWVSLKFSARFCSMCDLPIPKGLCCYWCSSCRYYIHIECGELPEHIDHLLHPLHTLKLTKRSLNESCCYYCEKTFQNDEYVYACDHQSCSDFYMHMTCAMIPLPTITSNESDHGVVHFSCHQQPMTLVDEHHHHSDKRGAKCFGCQLNWSGPAYSCISEKCENFLHKSCAELPQKIQHPFHLSHSLILQVSKPRSCRSCCRKDCRLIFACPEDGCNFTLGMECASFDMTVNCRSHDHLLSLVENSSCEIQCDACLKSYGDKVEVVPNEVTRTRSFIFRCMECVFNFHFLCGPLPSTIKYEYHMHPLILSNHLDSKDDLDKYYCDVCEEERDQSFRTYYCEECKFVAHIHCLLYEIMKAIKGETEDVELTILGENRWHLVNIESMHRQSKAISSDSTLKEIMDMLTEEEKKMLIDPFGFDNPTDTVSRRNAYNEFRRFNSRFDREGSIEDIERIQPLFHFDRQIIKLTLIQRFMSWKINSKDSSSPYREMNDFEKFQEELRYFTPEEGLLQLLDEKYLRQKVEDVNGFMVPKTLVLVLETLLGKYGRDLVGEENLTPAMKSITSTLLCIIIEKMCKTKVEDVTKEDLRNLYFNLTGIKRITGFKLSRYLNSFEDIMEVFLGFEAIRYEKGIREKLDLKMAMLEAEMEKCKKNHEKLKIYTSSMSEFMENCSNKAWKRRQMYWGDKWF